MRVNRRLVAVLSLVAVLAVLAALAAATPAAAGGDATRCTAYAVLSPKSEVRPPGTEVDSKAIGAALVHVNGTTVSYSVTILNPARETFTAGHIHVGAAGVNGGVVVPLFSGSNDRKIFFQAARTEASEATAAAICADPAGYYVNYHTTQEPAGAVRGQLIGI